VSSKCPDCGSTLGECPVCGGAGKPLPQFDEEGGLILSKQDRQQLARIESIVDEVLRRLSQ